MSLRAKLKTDHAIEISFKKQFKIQISRAKDQYYKSSEPLDNKERYCHITKKM